MLLDESNQDSQSESEDFSYADLKFSRPNSESRPSPALFSNASGFGIGRQATFNAANTINVLHRRRKEYQLVRAVPPGYHEGMSDCPAHTQYFTGRQDVLNVMEEYFINSPPSVKMGHQKIFLLFGLDGAGKTQSALAFAHKFKTFTKIYFVHANSEGDIQASYYDIAAGNELPTPHLSWNSGHRWFQTHKEEWLIIMDNADEPKLSLADFIPDCAHGNIIITSRNQGSSQNCWEVQGNQRHGPREWYSRYF
ncbi:hypothetical protein BT96DRAFT_1105699 [Gymnopus androsaceus JB14]|uniref:NB-ARC domain-containing protein n=1 Tax=Gymnopus androsaceus JB14 TaxID=1447944 RepID=A0A6A4HIT4_9AGAR|nr:hypothetical protein BT96DRAFT_1105699 [Gymnopus androsaceus JB14]